MRAAGINAELAGAVAPASTPERKFTVTITDTVTHATTVTAANVGDAYRKAMDLFEGGNREAHFTEHYDSTNDIEEIES